MTHSVACLASARKVWGFQGDTNGVPERQYVTARITLQLPHLSTPCQSVNVRAALHQTERSFSHARPMPCKRDRFHKLAWGPVPFCPGHTSLSPCNKCANATLAPVPLGHTGPPAPTRGWHWGAYPRLRFCPFYTTYLGQMARGNGSHPGAGRGLLNTVIKAV